jgi:RNase P subunit RPR2
LHNNIVKNERVAVLHQLAAHYLNIDLNKTKTYIDESEEIATEIQYEEGIGLSTHLRGVYHYQLHDY